ncbi:MAG TPA: thioredoxin family protein [Candidatus Acidoferrales bacterium]|nr:thioredoxin family protein [Candidatus Acidoferrales bacterium]
MSSQLLALAAAAVVVAAAYGLLRWRAAAAARGALHSAGPPAAEPYVLYFWGEGCTTCRTHQEPALRSLGVKVVKVDAVGEPELARRYRVYTLPTTVVMAADGRPLHVNYGFANAGKLRRQLAGSGRSASALPA